MSYDRFFEKQAAFSGFAFFLLLFLSTAGKSQQAVPYRDTTHYSAVFGHEKSYRRYLPAAYHSSEKRFPVVYFFHGWGGRHFKDDSALLDYSRLQELVDKYELILIMWDGNIDESEPRPYNVGNHEDVKFGVQMKDYFPELVAHIDSTYRTVPDRDNRGIIGFSMGGFMALYLSGKYPDMVCSMVSMMGSPEFFIGSPGNHTLYPVRYAFENLKGVGVRIHTSPDDILYYLNEEVRKGAWWEGKEIEVEEFPGGHMVDQSGEVIVFEKAVQFVAGFLGKPNEAPRPWSHSDLYPQFSVWDYRVYSNKDRPGFLYLKDVTKRGLGFYTKKWLPDGPPVEMDSVLLKTGPVYKPGALYNISAYSAKNGSVSVREVSSDREGRLSLKLDPSGTEIGIYENSDAAEWGFLDYHILGRRRLQPTPAVNPFSIRLYNRGQVTGSPERLKISLHSDDPGIMIRDSVLTMVVDEEERIAALAPVEVVCTKRPPLHAEPHEGKLGITVSDGRTTSHSTISVPVDFDVPYFPDIKIDDGKMIRDAPLGEGNGDGKANPGEYILLYAGENRLRIYADDPAIVHAKERFGDEMIPARWPDGFTRYSTIYISPDAAEGTEIDCLASYETKTFNPIERKVIWGRVKLTVSE